MLLPTLHAMYKNVLVGSAIIAIGFCPTFVGFTAIARFSFSTSGLRAVRIHLRANLKSAYRSGNRCLASHIDKYRARSRLSRGTRIHRVYRQRIWRLRRIRRGGLLGQVPGGIGYELADLAVIMRRREIEIAAHKHHGLRGTAARGRKSNCRDASRHSIQQNAADHRRAR